MVRSTHRAGRRTRPASLLVLALLAVASLWLTAGCGAPGGNSEPNHPLEKRQLSVGMLPIVDTAGFQIAMQRGFFKEEGLSIKIVPIEGGESATPKLNSGELDITWGNWVSYFQSQSKGQADLALLTDGYQAAEDMFLTVAMPDRGVDGPQDLRGKKIAVNTRNNIVELNLLTTLQSYGIQPEDVTLVPTPFPEMPEKLRTGEVDAASVLEPFLSKANQLGARTVLDIASGPTKDIPVAGFATTKDFTEKYPNTAAAFQRAMARGQTVASQNRDAVENVLPKFTETDPQTAALVRLGTFPRTLDATRLNRITSLMQVRGLLPPDFQVEPMIFRGSDSEQQ